MRKFIQTHRAEIDAYVRDVCRRPEMTLNDEDRRQWILNDETLYRWARSEGVRV